MRTAIITHNGTFHADEVTAIGLLIAFYLNEDEEYEVFRVPHQEDIDAQIKNCINNGYDDTFVLDIGRVLDPEKQRFDHHQFSSSESPYSSAGLIWNWLKDNNLILPAVADELGPVIQKVDENDIGVRPAEPGELSWTIANLNSEDVYSDTQDYMFIHAVLTVAHIFENIKNRAQMAEDAKAELENCKTFKLHPDDQFKVLEICEDCDAALKMWAKAIFDVPSLDDVDIVVNYKKSANEWHAQTVAQKKTDSQNAEEESVQLNRILKE